MTFSTSCCSVVKFPGFGKERGMLMAEEGTVLLSEGGLLGVEATQWRAGGNEESAGGALSCW